MDAGTFLNGTSVEKGNRIITSNLRLTNVFLDAEEAADKLAQHSLPASKAGCHIPLSTAAHMSARFTFVSPAGRFPDGSHIVDGGYFENSAATTALEIVSRIKEVCAHDGIANVDVKVIMISNDPRKGSIAIAPAKPGPEPPGPKRTKPMTKQGQFLGEVTAPLYTLLNTRNVRGTYAQKAIKREQRRFQVGVTTAPGETEETQPATKDIIYFTLRDTNVPLLSVGCCPPPLRRQCTINCDWRMTLSTMERPWTKCSGSCPRQRTNAPAREDFRSLEATPSSSCRFEAN
jgi:hypothetical protein